MYAVQLEEERRFRPSLRAVPVHRRLDLGFRLVRGVVSATRVDEVLDDLHGLCEAAAGRRWRGAHDPRLARWLGQQRAAQSMIYGEIRGRASVQALARDAGILQAVREVLGDEPLAFGVYDKVPVRIDTPLETTELAVWHQDHHYVGGNTEVVTAWIPLQDTGYREGCLQVMPGTHTLGPLPHDNQILGKRHFPDGLDRYDIRLLPMRRGDVLLFHSCLLHSGSLNLSEAVRYSVQPRYTRLDLPSDPAMGRVHRVGPGEVA